MAVSSGAESVFGSRSAGGGASPGAETVFGPSGGPSSGAAAVFGSAPAAQAAPAPAKPSGNIFTRAVGDVGSMIVHAPVGLLTLAGETGRLGLHAGENFVNDVANTHLGPASGYRSGGVLPTQAQITSTLNANPAYRGIVEGYKQLGNEAAHPTQLGRDLSAHPIGTLVNAVADLAPGAGALGRVGDIAEAAGRGGALSKAAQGVGKAGHVAQEVINAPIAGPMKLPRLAGNMAHDRAMGAAAEGRTAGPVTRVLARAAEPMHATSTANLEGSAHEGQIRSALQGLEMKVSKTLPDRDAQAAWVTHIQGESPAYALLERHAPDALDAFVARTKGTLTPRAAKMAADVANGRDPELADKFDQVTKAFDDGMGKAGLGSLARMDEAYTSAHPWQASYAANPEAMGKLSAKGTAAISKALKAVAQANDRAVSDRRGADLLREQSYAKAAENAQAANVRNRAALGLPSASNELPVETPSLPPRPASPRQQAILGERSRVAETAASTEGRLAHPNYLVGAAEDRARESGAQVAKAVDNLQVTRNAAMRAEAGTANRIENAPSRLRPAMETNREATSALAGQVNSLRAQGLNDAAKAVEAAIGELPTTLRQMSDQDFQARYVHHAQEGRPGANTVAPRNKQGLPRPQTPNSLKEREASPVYDRSFEGVTKGIADRLIYQARQATAEKIAALPFAARLNEGALAGVTTKAEAEAKGYVAWQPGSLFDKAGQVRSLDDYDAQLGITGDTVFVPKPVFDSFRNYFEPRHGDLLRLMSTPGNKVWMMTRLAFSPSLIVGRVVGHTMVAMAHEGHNPYATARGIAKAYRLWKESGGETEPGKLRSIIHPEQTGRSFASFVPARIPKAGSAEAEVSRLRDEQKEAQAMAASGQTAKGRGIGMVGRGLSKANAKLDAAAAAPLHAAGFWDNLNRSAFYLIEKGRGASDDDAVRAALRATGEFDRLTPFERDYMRAIVPFWSWHREITRIVAHMAEDNPLKTAWLLHLGNIGASNESPLPGYNQGDIGIGNALVSPGFLVPFTEAGSPFGGGLAGLGKVMGPLPRLALTNVLTHESPSTGKPYYMPPGTPTVQGNPAPPSLLTQVASMIPQTRVLGGITGANKVDRYANGEPVLTKAGGYKPQPTGQTLGTSLLGLAGLTVGDKALAQKQAAQSAASSAKTAGTSSKTKARYEAVKRSVFPQG